MRHIRRDDDEVMAVRLREGAILREERSNGDDLAVRDGQGPQDGDERRGGAAGEKQILGPDARLEAAVQIVRHGLADAVIAGGGGVAMDEEGVLVAGNIHDRIIDLRRGRDGRIAQGVVKDIFLTAEGGLLQAVFK